MFTAPLYDGETIERDGVIYTVSIEGDDDSGTPWDNECGHGPVSDWTDRDKLPGELVLHSDGGWYRYYDYAEACRIARSDGWGISADPQRDGETTRAYRARAAMADYDRLRQWCNDVWSYVGIIVTADDGRSASLWGIESDAGEYLVEVANELIDECA